MTSADPARREPCANCKKPMAPNTPDEFFCKQECHIAWYKKQNDAKTVEE